MHVRGVAVATPHVAVFDVVVVERVIVHGVDGTFLVETLQRSCTKLWNHLLKPLFCDTRLECCVRNCELFCSKFVKYRTWNFDRSLDQTTQHFVNCRSGMVSGSLVFMAFSMVDIWNHFEVILTCRRTLKVHTSTPN